VQHFNAVVLYNSLPAAWTEQLTHFCVAFLAEFLNSLEIIFTVGGI